MEPIEEFDHNGSQVSIYRDDSPENPWDDDNLGRMVCWHRRSNLGDEQIRHLFGQFHSPEEVEQWLKEERKAVVVLPIYIYEHGSIILTARYEEYLRFPDKEWDAGQVGYIYADEESVKNNYMVQEITQETREQAAKLLASEVDEYNMWLNGDVWTYVIKRDGEVTDSCGGFFGLDYAREQAKKAAARD